MKKTIKWMTIAAASAFACVAFVACKPSTLEKAEEKLTELGYTVELETTKIDGCEGRLYATKSEDGVLDKLYAYLFETTEDAKAFFEKYEKVSNESSNTLSPVRDGKWVYLGTEGAVSDFID